MMCYYFLRPMRKHLASSSYINVFFFFISLKIIIPFFSFCFLLAIKKNVLIIHFGILRFVDIDECASGTHNCHSLRASCTNTVGSFSCSCDNPYTGNGRTCNLVSGNQLAEILGRCPFTKPLICRHRERRYIW